ncbi:hypothetical protein BH10BAC5_BH10BAC5_18780 [soil metagenome]
MQALNRPEIVIKPEQGWIKTIRKALGMSQQQLAVKLRKTKQSVFELERREEEGAITLKIFK